MLISSQAYKDAIAKSCKSIYEFDEKFYIPTLALQELLNTGLIGLSLADLPLRTRSKVVKSAVCSALGYPIPSSFKKVQPRFTSQNFDTYVQKSLNLQIWNEELSASRRYAIIQVNNDDEIIGVKVITGKDLEILDTTGTITKKYQARFILGNEKAELITPLDSDAILGHLAESQADLKNLSPATPPQSKKLLPISELFNKLSELLGSSFPNPGISKERARGAELQKLVSHKLGFGTYDDNGQFPDVFNQILEVKLQTSPTIDLGLILPSGDEEIILNNPGLKGIKHKDARYAIFYGETDNTNVLLTHLVVTNGEDFFKRFQRFEGKITNGKIQLKLPNNFFDL